MYRPPVKSNTINMRELKQTPSFTVASHRTPFTWLTPTHLAFASTSAPDQSVTWQSRRARKGRYAPKATHVDHHETQKLALTARVWEKGTRMKPGFYLDISWWLAFTFTLGSAVWVVNGFMVWFPILRPALDTTAFSHTSSATAFVGASIFEVGAYLGVIEVLVRDREVTGTALGDLLHRCRRLPSSDPFSTANATPKEIIKKEETEVKEFLESVKGWVWWGKPRWHDMGYLAAIVQMFAATIFWVSSLTGLPGVIPGFSDGGGSVAIVDVFFWTPQVVGGCGFVATSLILMLEVQKKWYIPALGDIGWHVAFWNLIGGIGFTLCGALGYSTSSGAEYQSGLSTWWGSWAFLIGSVLQLGEASFREPSA